MEDYLTHLKKCCSLYHIDMWTAHQHKLSREVALEYGVTEAQLSELDVTLKSTD